MGFFSENYILFSEFNVCHTYHMIWHKDLKFVNMCCKYFVMSSYNRMLFCVQASVYVCSSFISECELWSPSYWLYPSFHKVINRELLAHQCNWNRKLYMWNSHATYYICERNNVNCHCGNALCKAEIKK